MIYKWMCHAGAIAILYFQVANAMWFGNPAQSSFENQSGVSLVSDFGSRKIVRLSREFPPIDLESQRFYVQGNYGAGPYAQIFGRAMPSTGRLHFEERSFNPALWGLGFGGQICTPTLGHSFSLGIVAMWDVVVGAQKGNSAKFRRIFDYFIGERANYVTWREGALVAGASWRAKKNLNLYGGMSYVRSRINLHFENQDNQRFDNDKTVGAFAGVNLSLSSAWLLNSEVHMGNERTVNLIASYRFANAK